jgi:hypothetical protein
MCFCMCAMYVCLSRPRLLHAVLLQRSHACMHIENEKGARSETKPSVIARKQMNHSQWH